MKRYILAALAIIGMTGNVLAQDWTGKGNTVAAGDYYLYNVKSGKYLTWGTNYGTRASLVQQAGELFTLTASGSGYKITAPGITKDKKGMFLNSSNIPFCDNDAVEFTFTETSAGSKVYTISSNSRYLACRSDYSAEPSPLETVTDASNDGATWMLIKKQDRIDALDTATASNPMEATFYIKGAEINQYFDNAGAWDGTDPTFNGRTGNLEATGYAAENYWGENVESYQTLTGLPAGKYRLSCYGFYRDGSAQEAATKNANGTESIKAYLFAGSNQTPLSSIMAGAHTSNGDGGVEAVSGKWVPNSMTEAVLFFFRGRYPVVTVDAIVGEDGQLKIGIRKDASTKEKWTIWDRFRLTYYGDDLTAYAASLAEAVDAANTFINSHVVPEAAGEAITEVINANNKEYETKAGYIAATEAINNAVAQYNTVELKSAYAAYYDFKAKVEGLMSGVDDGQPKTDFTDAINTATTSMEDCTTVDGIYTQKAALRSAAMTFISTTDGQFNITFLASQKYSDWKKKDGSAAGIVADQYLSNRPADIPSFAESFEWTASTTGDVLYQTVSNLPAGYYQVGMYAMALSTSQRGTGITTEATEGDADRSFAFAGDQRTGLPIKFATAINFDDLTTLDVNVHLSNDGDLTFGVHKDANGSNWHFAQIASIVYSNAPDLTNLKATRDALVSEAEGLLASADADFLTDTQKAALQDAIDAGNDADDFDNLNTVTLTTLPNAINAAKQQIQQVKQNRTEMIAALERFENDYNLADGTDYRKVTMSADAWATLITKVNAVSTALDDVSLASSYSTVKNELVDQLNATDTSLRLFKSYKAMVEGTTALNISEGTTYAADSYMDTDAKENEAITALNTAFVTYAGNQTADFDVADFLGENLDFNAAEGDAYVNTNAQKIYDIAGWEESYSNTDNNGWVFIRTADSNNSSKLYLRTNWQTTAGASVLTSKEKMLPVGKYKLTLSWNSNMANMTNSSQYVLDGTTTTIGQATSGAETLTYAFEVTDNAKPFDLQLGFVSTGKDGNDYPAQIVVDEVTLTYLQSNLSLDNNADNTQTIKERAGVAFNVTLADRYLYKDNSWNTLCLPFNLSSLTGTPLEGATLKELDTEAGSYEHKTGLDGTTLYLNFKTAESIVAGKPYIIKWASGDPFTPVFNNVTLVAGSPDKVKSAESTDGSVSFIGTYGPVGLTKDNQNNLFLGADNTLYWPSVDNYTVNAFRAYFLVNAPATARQFILNFGDDTTTGIDGASLNNKEERIKNQYFDLSGRKLDGRPSRPGIYMRNGQKVIIK